MYLAAELLLGSCCVTHLCCRNSIQLFFFTAAPPDLIGAVLQQGPACRQAGIQQIRTNK